MAEDAQTTVSSKSKESETLSKTSLIHLARGLGKDPNGLTLPMLLNLPTIAIIKFIYENSPSGLLNDESYTIQAAVVEKCVLMWRHNTRDQKNKERFKALEKAVREMGKIDLADGLLDRFQNNQEITPDIFA